MVLLICFVDEFYLVIIYYVISVYTFTSRFCQCMELIFFNIDAVASLGFALRKGSVLFKSQHEMVLFFSTTNERVTFASTFGLVVSNVFIILLFFNSFKHYKLCT